MMIEIKNLFKDYKVIVRQPGLVGMMKSFIKPEHEIIHAVQNINMHIDTGEIVGYVGPNGSGKSTTIKMLSGILEPTSGEIRISGLIPSKDRIKNAFNIGVVFGQRTQLWWDLPVQETFDLLYRLYNIPNSRYKENVDEFTYVLGLKEVMNKPVRQLSLGQRMRAELAAALIHDPKVLFLDEPTIGLDVEVKHRIWEFIKRINAERKVTILLTSHDMQDIENLSNRLVVINHGELVFDGTVDTLKKQYIKKFKAVFVLKNEADIADSMCQFGGLARGIQKSHILTVEYDCRIASAEIVNYVMQRYPVVDLKLEGSNIDDVIMEVYRAKKNI